MEEAFGGQPGSNKAAYALVYVNQYVMSAMQNQESPVYAADGARYIPQELYDEIQSQNKQFSNLSKKCTAN